MLVLGIAVVVALLLPLITGGSYTRLVMTPWRWGGLLFAGLAVQLFLETGRLDDSRWHDLGFGLLIASYVLILGFCAGNVLLRGMAIVLIGVACNAVVIAANEGMPVDVPPDWQNEAWVRSTIKHHPQEPGEDLLFLSDIVVLRSPFDTVLSFGDLIHAVGLCDLTFHASRRPRRGRSRATGAMTETARPAATIDLTSWPGTGPPVPQRALERREDPFVVQVSRR